MPFYRYEIVKRRSPWECSHHSKHYSRSGRSMPPLTTKILIESTNPKLIYPSNLGINVRSIGGGIRSSFRSLRSLAYFPHECSRRLTKNRRNQSDFKNKQWGYSGKGVACIPWFFLDTCIRSRTNERREDRSSKTSRSEH